MSVASVSFSAAREAGRTVDRLLERPRTVLGVLVCTQLAGTLFLALTIPHNGWVFFQGGDQIGFSTTGWLAGQLDLPLTETAYLWPFVQAPVTWGTGPTYLQAVPALILLQVLVLAPIAVLCIYGIAARIGGRLLGYWASLLWVVAPFAAIPLFTERYQERWTEHFLPQALGLTAMADYASMVLVLAAAFFALRSLSPNRLADAVFAGLLIGAAGALKPPNLLVAVGVGLAYLAARRWHEGVACAAAAVPALLVLVLWKYRGLGEIPAFALEQARLAAGSGPVALSLDRYLELDVDHWRKQMNYLREFFWSARLAQWVPFAGLLAVLRMRRGAVAALLAGWLGAFLVVKGFSTRADIEANTFWRLLMPAWPAYLLLFASIPLLIPTLARRLGERLHTTVGGPIAPRWIALAAVLTVAVPAVAIAASSRIEPPTPAVVQEFPTGNILTPVDESIELEVERTRSGQELTWTTGSWRANVFYRVYRTDQPGQDVQCALSSGAAWSCFLRTTPIHTTREQMFVDTSRPAGATYRIGVGTNWLDDPEQGDIFAFSPPVSAAR
ncbi:MAG: hypothetical protein H0U82_00500 [Actinobacteria bacterium]|nr:hypothetical protein [Actinomycetota bacterium]